MSSGSPTSPMSTVPPLLPPVEVDGYRIREWPMDDLGTLATLLPNGPLYGRDLTHAQARVVVIEDATTDTVLAYWPVFGAIHIDCLYVDPSLRHHAKVQFAFLGALVTMLQSIGVGHVFAIIGAKQPENAELAIKMGLAPVLGRLYEGSIPPKEPQ